MADIAATHTLAKRILAGLCGAQLVFTVDGHQVACVVQDVEATVEGDEIAFHGTFASIGQPVSVPSGRVN